MAQSNYQEPIEKEDLDLGKKLKTGSGEKTVSSGERAAGSEGIEAGKKESMAEKMPLPEKETLPETAAEQVTEKIETARKTIQTQKPAAAASVALDAQSVSQIAEYGKKVEKLVQIALERGPVHAIKVAQHLDSRDDYTLDALHDKMIEDDLRKQLFQKGLLKEL